MSESTPSGSAPSDRPPPATSTVTAPGTSQESGWRRWSVLLPALAFVVGLALGAAVVGVSQLGESGSEEPLAAPSATPEPQPEPVGSPSPSPLVITVPAPCVEAAEQAETAYDVLDRAVTAVRELDARQLADVVDAAQTERAETEALVDACRAAAGDQLVEPAATGGAETPSS